ncbi:MAG: hypothetical protein ACPGNT_08335 [Rhodospirillales bacterium]
MPFDQAPIHQANANLQFPDLRFAEQLALWSVRFWSTGHAADRNVLPPLMAAYAHAGAADALPAFDHLMTALIIGGKRPLRLNPLCCRHLTADEVRFLDLTGEATTRRAERAAIILETWLSPKLALRTAPAAGRYGLAMARAGLILPRRCWNAAAFPDRPQVIVHPLTREPAALH